MFPLHYATDHDQLFFLVYEKMAINSNSMEPHLWSYRQRISLEHLGQTLQEQKLKEKFPILHEFLQAVSLFFFIYRMFGIMLHIY